MLLPANRSLWPWWVFFAVYVMASFHSHSLMTSVPQMSFWFCGAFLALFLIQRTDNQIDRLIFGLLCVAAFQGVLAVVQVLRFPLLPSSLILNKPSEVIGTIGNREFFATFLAFNFLAGLGLYFKAVNEKKRFLIIGLLTCCCIGLLLTRSKGTLLILLILLLVRWVRNRWVVAGLTIAALAIVLVSFPDSVKGRLLLWFSSVVVVLKHPLLGVGPGMFGSYYVDSVIEIFSRFPMLRDSLGSYTSVVRDAHNLPLQMATDIGVVGFLLSSIGLTFLFRTAWARPSFLSSAVILLIMKSLYTVVLSSVSGMLLAVVGIACLLRKTFSGTVSSARPPVFILIGILVLVGGGFSVCVWTSDFFYQRGIQALHRIDPTRAAENLAKAVAMNPENSDVQLALAFNRFTVRDISLMDFHIKEAIDNRKNMDTLKISAHMYYHRGQLNQAKSLYMTVLSAYPDHFTSKVKLAEIAFQQGDFLGARKLAQEASQIKPRRDNDSDERNRLTVNDLLRRTEPISPRREK